MTAHPVKESVRTAREGAAQVADLAASGAGAARDWVAPLTSKGAAAAGPHLEAARERLVKDVVPHVLEALNSAAAAAASSAEQAAATAKQAATAGAHSAAAGVHSAAAGVQSAAAGVQSAAAEVARAVPERHRSRWVALLVALVAAAGAAVVLRGRARQQDDSWISVEEPAPSGTS